MFDDAFPGVRDITAFHCEYREDNRSYQVQRVGPNRGSFLTHGVTDTHPDLVIAMVTCG